MLEAYAASLLEKNKNLYVPWYLMAAYAYYVESDPIFSDAFFDQMGKTMLKEWDNIEHFHKHHITVDDLNAGTYLGEYPERVKGGLKEVRNIDKKKAPAKKAKPKKSPPPNTIGNFGMDLFDFGD